MGMVSDPVAGRVLDYAGRLAAGVAVRVYAVGPDGPPFATEPVSTGGARENAVTAILEVVGPARLLGALSGSDDGFEVSASVSARLPVPMPSPEASRGR